MNHFEPDYDADNPILRGGQPVNEPANLTDAFTREAEDFITRHRAQPFFLVVAWYLDLPNDVGLVSTPLVVDGILYFVGTMNVVRAVEATSGKLIWEYDPEVGKHVGKRRKVGWVHNRGLSFYQGKVLAATWDGRLLALSCLDLVSHPIFAFEYPNRESLLDRPVPERILE
jgi:hypothetical protein